MGGIKKGWPGFGIICIFYVISLIPTLAVESPAVPQEGIGKFFPLYEEYQGEEYSIGAVLFSPFRQVTKIDEVSGEFNVTTISNDFEYSGRLDKTLKPLESIFVFKNESLIKYLGHEKRVTKYDPLKNRLMVYYYLKGKVKSYKEFSYEQNVVDSDTILLFLQGMLLKNTGNFNTDIIQKAKGVRVNAHFEFILSADLQGISPQYTLPEGFKARTEQLQEVSVYVMQLTGIASLIYPHKYYFVFQQEPPHQLIAYWGGAPKEEEYGFVTERIGD